MVKEINIYWFFFCSVQYDLEKIADAINKEFLCPVVGRTTVGEIGSPMNAIIGMAYLALGTNLNPE
ncbi:FIST N-terminal domain-containing protein [Desulforhopalus sp. 52FAK]